jgi:hypothetical protein
MSRILAERLTGDFYMLEGDILNVTYSGNDYHDVLIQHKVTKNMKFNKVIIHEQDKVGDMINCLSITLGSVIE